MTAPKKLCLTSCGVVPAAPRSLGQAPSRNSVPLQLPVSMPAEDAFLTGYATTQTLYLDDQSGVTITGSVNISGQGSHLYFGGGYTGGNWPSEPHYKQTNAPDTSTATSPPFSTATPVDPADEPGVERRGRAWEGRARTAPLGCARIGPRSGPRTQDRATELRDGRRP